VQLVLVKAIEQESSEHATQPNLVTSSY
jgi:hypothetical protein